MVTGLDIMYINWNIKRNKSNIHRFALPSFNVDIPKLIH